MWLSTIYLWYKNNFSPHILYIFNFKQAQYEWSYVFILCAGIYLVGLIVYSVFAQADLETWAISNDEKVVEDLDNIELEKKKKPTTMNEKEDGIVLESPTKF